MAWIFLLCAVFGATVLVGQFFLGFGAEHDDGFDGPEDAPDAIDDFDHDGHDHHDHDESHHDSTWLFGVLTMRTILIGITFFGLTGRLALASGYDGAQSVFFAIAGALVSMYGIYFLMRTLMRLTADGTERISRAVGEEGTVYLSIPAHNQGLGKIHVTVQNRMLEYEAMTSGERLPTGTRCVVVNVLGSDRVAVEPLPQTSPSIEPVGNENV
jgi:hypothetical protein